MVMFAQSDGAKPVDERWHEKRQEARETAFDLAEFSDHEITRFDLETAGITGRDNPKSFEWDPAIRGIKSEDVDVRDLPRR